MPSALPEKRSSQRFRETKRFKDAARALGRQVRQVREDRGLTLDQASALMEVDLKHLQKVEAGQLNVTLVTLLRIADGLGVAPGSLFGQVPQGRRRKARAVE